METVSRLLGSISKQKRGVADKLQAQHWSHHFKLDSPHYSSSQHLSSPRFIPLLTSGYLTAKTNCLTVGIHNSSYTLLIYTNTVLLLHANMGKVCKPCDANIILTCSGSCWKKEVLFQLLHPTYLYINIVFPTHTQHMLLLEKKKQNWHLPVMPVYLYFFYFSHNIFWRSCTFEKQDVSGNIKSCFLLLKQWMENKYMQFAFQYVKGSLCSLEVQFDNLYICSFTGIWQPGSSSWPTLQPLPGTQRLQREVFQWTKQEVWQGGQQVRCQWRVNQSMAHDRRSLFRVSL